MEYRGAEITVVRSMSPNGWRWSAKREGREKAGMATSEETAIRQAMNFIDRLTRLGAGKYRK